MSRAPEPDDASGRPTNRSARAVALTCLIGLVLTTVSAWAAYRADEAAEKSLLETQTQQAAAVLSTAINLIQQPLTTGLQVQAAAGPDGDPSVFRRTFAVNVGDEALFVSASLWRRDGRGLTRLAAIGAAPGMDPRGPEVQEAPRARTEQRVIGRRTRDGRRADPDRLRARRSRPPGSW